MPGERKCKRCGLVEPKDSSRGSCPVCALKAALLLGEGSEVEPSAHAAEWIGPYRLVKKLGEGGYGVVYLAERVDPIRFWVALKVIKPGMDCAEVIGRFEAERQALALMNHPSIAKVFDAGATASGRPFFVMELVRGLPITEHCDRHSLPTADRLALFGQVCQAVQHAHQKGVIHRDLKPSNILVAIEDGRATPKVIDFGVAKAVGAALTVDPFKTTHHHFMGTPAYMSPEQVGFGGQDVDTRSDVYALGVLLYELLTGRTPFEPDALLEAGLEEIRRVIREDEPPKPSTKLGALTVAELEGAAAQHGTEPPRLMSSVKGDLDWIVMKCLEKDRVRRYDTAQALALDIERHLHHEPVSAAAPSRRYRLEKFARKHRASLAVTAIMAAVLIAGTAVSLWLAVRATAAERASRVEAAKSRQTARFLKDMLDAVDPAVALGRDTTVLQGLLDRTAARVGRELAGQPEVEADLENTIGNVYEALGDYGKAEAMLHKALALRRSVFGEKHLRVADSVHDLGGLRRAQSRPAEAETLFRQALAIRESRLARDAPEIASSLSAIGVACMAQGKMSEAEKLQNQALEIWRRRFGPDSAEVALGMNDLGNVLLVTGRLNDAEARFRAAVKVRRNVLGASHPLLATSLGNLGSVLLYEGKLDEAEGLYRETLAMQRQLLVPEHPDVGTSMHNLGCVLVGQGKLAASDAAFAEAVRIRVKLFGTNNTDTASTLSAYSSVLLSEGRFAEAEAAQRAAFAPQRKVSLDSQDLAASFNNLGDILRAEGRFSEAETNLEAALAIIKKVAGPESSIGASFLGTLGNSLRDAGRLPEAETVQRDALAMHRKADGLENVNTAQALHDLATVLSRSERLEEADDLFGQALAQRRKLLRSGHPDTADTLLARAAILQKRGNLAEALKLSRESLSDFEKELPDDWKTFAAQLRVGSVLLAQQSFAESERFLLAAHDGLSLRRERIPAADRGRIQEGISQIVALYDQTSQAGKASEWRKKLSP